MYYAPPSLKFATAQRVSGKKKQGEILDAMNLYKCLCIWFVSACDFKFEQCLPGRALEIPNNLPLSLSLFLNHEENACSPLTMK